MTIIRSNRPNGLRGSGPVKGAGAVRSGNEDGKEVKKGEPSAKVSLSDDVAMLGSIRKSLEQVPSMDEKRVAALREAIREGRYKPDFGLMASRIMDEAVLQSARAERA